MSEVALVAAITGGTSVLTSAITAAVTWAVSQNSTSVELAKVEAENRRLLENNREDERRNRQSTYYQFLDALNALFQILGTAAPLEDRRKVCTEFNHLLSGVILFGPPSVREGAFAVNTVYKKIWPAYGEKKEANPEAPSAEWWRDATIDLRDEFVKVTGDLARLMHADVTKGIAEDPERR